MFALQAKSYRFKSDYFHSYFLPISINFLFYLMLYKFAKKEKKILKTNNLIEKLIKLDFLILEKDSLFFKNSKYIHFYTIN